MDQDRFPAISHALTRLPSRRDVLRGLMGAGLAFGLARQSLPAAAKCVKLGRTCKTKRGKKRCCGGVTCQGKRCRCPADREPCDATCCAKGSVCDGGTCVACDVCRGGCTFTRVQAAVDATDPGGSIRLCPGAYREHVMISKNLVLLGVGKERTVLDGGGVMAPTGVLTIASGTTAEVRAVTVMGGNHSLGSGGGVVNGGTLTLDRVNVTANKAAEGAGIYTQAGGALILNGSRVSGNDAFYDGGGVYVQGGTVTLNASHVTGNETGSRGGGIYLQHHSLDSPAVALTASRVSGNTAGEGGGVYKSGGSITIEPGSVTGNTPNNCAGQAVGNCAN
jgi:hypothetical protein